MVNYTLYIIKCLSTTLVQYLTDCYATQNKKISIGSHFKYVPAHFKYLRQERVEFNEFNQLYVKANNRNRGF